MISYAKRKERGDKHASGTSYKQMKENNTLKPRSRVSKSLLRSDRPFIAYDSEGVTLDNGEHVTVLWANSEGYYIYNEKGLERESVYDWMIENAERFPKAINVVYGGSYDQNMLIKGINIDKARDIWQNKGDNYTFAGNYAIKIIPRRQFSIAKFKDNNPWILSKDGKKKLNVGKVFLFYDVIGFFQDKFINVVKKNLGQDYEDFDLIVKGKDLRHEFNNIDKDFILAYCRAELKALVLIMNELREGLFKNGLKLKAWYGGGSIASAMMDKHNIKSHINRELEQPPLDILLRGFFGGRIEIMKYGYTEKKIYHDDINSCYPYAMTLLPSMADGRWEYCDSGIIHSEPLTIYHIKWKNTDYSFKHKGRLSFNPFPWRHVHGKVIFPDEGENWIWSPELLAALKYIYLDNIEILESWRFIPSINDNPFSYIFEYYKKRQDLIINGIKTFEEKVLKLGLNSGFGKTAQSIGAKRSKPAPFQHFAYCGFITSKARAMLYERAMISPHDILSFSTDGIFSTKYLGDDNVSNSKQLGKWECCNHDGILIAQSGVYFCKNNGAWTWKTRGIQSPKNIHEADQLREKILNIWKGGGDKLEYTRNVFITIGTALTGDNYLRHCKWEDQTKELKLNPIGTKRKLINSNNNPHLNLVDTLPISIYDIGKTVDLMSSPYQPKWRVEDDELRELEDDELGLE